MSNNKTDYLENAVLNHFLRNVSTASPTAVELALFITIPADDGTGGVEVSGNGYSRQIITFNAPVNGSTSNSGAVTFPVATPSGWGTVLGLGIYVQGGQLLYYGPLTVSKTVGVGDQLSFAAGTVTVVET